MVLVEFLVCCLLGDLKVQSQVSTGSMTISSHEQGNGAALHSRVLRAGQNVYLHGERARQREEDETKETEEKFDGADKVHRAVSNRVSGH